MKIINLNIARVQIKRMLIIAGICMLTACNRSEGENMMNVKKEKITRRAYGAGRWFPGDPKQLKLMVDKFIDSANVPPVKERIVAAIAPHAGYIYSGGVAGHTFRALKDNARTGQGADVVVILGFSHSASFSGVAVMDGDMLNTPLGNVTLDKEAAQILMNGRSRIVFNYTPHTEEHSAENEIPFVQAALPDVGIVVALIGDHDGQTLAELVSGLNELAKTKKVLVVASTDMLHYSDYDVVTRTDKETLRKIGAMEHKTLMKEWSYSNQFLCGIMPVLAAMQFAEAQGCEKGSELLYRNSGDEFPESRGNYVVGYGAVVFAVEVKPGE